MDSDEVRNGNLGKTARALGGMVELLREKGLDVRTAEVLLRKVDATLRSGDDKNAMKHMLDAARELKRLDGESRKAGVAQ
jgi:hypothetical protein